MATGEKRVETVELRNQLRQVAGSTRPGTVKAKRDLFRRVISYMTVSANLLALPVSGFLSGGRNGEERGREGGALTAFSSSDFYLYVGGKSYTASHMFFDVCDYIQWFL